MFDIFDPVVVVVVVTLFSNIIQEQNTSNTNLTNKAYPGYCKHVLCWRPPEKALAFLAGGSGPKFANMCCWYYWKPKVVIIYFVGVSGTTGYHNDNLRGRNWR